MAYFNMIELREDEQRNDDKKYSISFQAHNIIQMFMFFLPKVQIDGSSKISILFEKKTEDKPQYFRNDYFHISTYYVDESTLNIANKISLEEKNEFFLSVIENVLSDIASKVGNNEVIDAIHGAADRVREHNYEMILKMEKLSKGSKDRRYKAITYIKINSLGECAYVEIIDDKKQVQKVDITEPITFVSLNQIIKKCEWRDHSFVMMNNLGKELVSIDLSDGNIKVKSVYKR